MSSEHVHYQINIADLYSFKKTHTILIKLHLY